MVGLSPLMGEERCVNGCARVGIGSLCFPLSSGAWVSVHPDGLFRSRYLREEPAWEKVARDVRGKDPGM